MCLMKSDEASAALDYIHDQLPYVHIEVHTTYYRFEANAKIRLDLAEVSEYLGRALSMRTFLGILSSYYGNIDVQEDLLTISPETAAAMLRSRAD